MTQAEINYGHPALTGIPLRMQSWGLHLEQPYPSAFGEYVVTDIRPADIEQHHQVEVINEDGDPLRGVWVIFGFPGGGPEIGLTPLESHWRGAPQVLRGNAQVTNGAGYAQHTFKSGGEDIWIWDLDDEGVLRLPSPIVKNCKWASTPIGRFEHTGVKIQFQRRIIGVKPRAQRLDELEMRVAVLEHRLAAQTRATWRASGQEQASE